VESEIYMIYVDTDLGLSRNDFISSLILFLCDLK